jgi:hypothetical protein
MMLLRAVEVSLYGDPSAMLVQMLSCDDPLSISAAFARIGTLRTGNHLSTNTHGLFVFALVISPTNKR